MIQIVGRFRFRFPVIPLLAIASLAAMPSRNAIAQPAGGVPLYYAAHYSPATAASLQIQAEGQYLRAYGQLEKDLADARIRHAEAQQLEGQNARQALRDHLERRELLDAERGKQIAKRLTNPRDSNKRILERLKNHPELNGNEVATGVALNFLKNRLSSTVVTFRSDSMGSREAVRDVSAQLHVTSAIVHALQVRQNLQRGESFVFRLDDGKALQVDWWPPALRVPELQDVRSRFEAARAKAFELQSSSDFYANIRNLILTHAALDEAFLRGQTHAVRIKSTQACMAYYDGKTFLQTLSAEIRRMEKLGHGGSSPQSLAFQGDELPELLTHMVRNGLEFAPAKPGDEPAYQQVFHMLRDLYVAFEADAEQYEPTKAAAK